MYKNLLIRGVLPIALVIALFMAAAFLVIIPSFERSIMEQKREMIRELTNSAWNVIAKFEYDERAGLMTREQAQKAAIAQIQNLHYGSEMKDYFWINDMHPRMVIHPYRIDLNGKDLSEFADPNGKRLFVEMVGVVKRDGAGYVDYMWQRKDDPTRIVPKISYVKGFAPWGWIVGTGVYIYDALEEMRSMKSSLMGVSLAVIAISAAILVYLLSVQYRTEQARVRSDEALRESEEKYRVLVESAGEGIIMAVPGEKIFANQNILRKLGYSIEEFAVLSLDDVILPPDSELRDGGPYHRKHLAGEVAPGKFESALKTRDGATVPVMLSFSRIEFQGREGVIAVATDAARSSRNELVREKVMTELQTAFLNFNQPVADICDRSPLKFFSDDGCGAIVRRMREASRESALICSDDGVTVTGVISAADLLDPAFIKLAAADLPAIEYSGLRPPSFIDGATVLFEAFLKLEQNGFAPLVVSGLAGKSPGVLEKNHLLVVQSYSPTKFLREISRAASTEEIIGLSKRLPELAAILVTNGVKALHVNHFITQAADAVIARMLEFAAEKLGPAPVPFSFLVMGSEGRFEQTLKTDQDNAIVFADPPAADLHRVKAYFDSLGATVCGWLADSGYSACEGDVMARNVKWCQPLSAWKRYFAEWIEKSEAEDLLKTKIFFDFRTACGDGSLAGELRASLWPRLSSNPRFFFLLARDVLRYEPPVGLFGNFVQAQGTGGHAGKGIDIKAVMTFIVDFARIYGLRSGIAETNSIARLAALSEKGVLKASSYEELSQAYSYLMHLRLDNQVKKYRASGAADNEIDPYSLTSIDQKMLKEVFAQIKHFQVRLSYDFTGTSEQI